MACAICEIRRPKRFCPGVRGEICSICCGTEREVTVDCPLDCEYLQEARRREKPTPVEEAAIPNRDIKVTETFLRDNEPLLVFTGRSLAGASFETGAIDFDVREALDALIRTYRTLQSGVYYESQPANLMAANIYRALQDALAEFRKREQESLGLSKTRDADVLGVLVFLQRIELDRNNGRRRGRAFLDELRGFYSAEPGSPETATSSLILP
jgi:hypothetical protein